MRRHRNDDQTPGQDSFLDVVANLVGILVILIMVVGMRTRGAWQEARRQQPASAAAGATQDAEDEQAEQDESRRQLAAAVQRAEREAQALLAASRQAQLDRQRMRAELVMRQLERDQLNVMLVGLQREVSAEREQLDRQARQKSDLLDQLENLNHELGSLEFQIEAADETTAEPVVLDHVPTPMAKTVFGHEEHYRLQAGRLAYVPLNTLLDRLKQDARHQSDQLRRTQQVTNTIGPEGGFRLRYTLARRNVEVETKAGRQVHEMAQLTEFELLPIADQLGDPLDDQLAPGSPLEEQLADWKPKQTVITIWTYPDSYEQFRNLKRYLEQRGFLTAARPLPHGQHISGSPHGSHSAAQ